MKNLTDHILVVVACLAGGSFCCPSVVRAASDEARVTRIVHDVKLLPSKAKPKPAALNDTVKDGTGVRTGDASRSELTFSDVTIERLGENTVFSFNLGGRSVSLNNGSMLLRVPKDSGGATMSTSAVTVGITGTTVILEAKRRHRLIVLEGGARVTLNRNRNDSVYVRGGQMEDVPPGATKLPPPVNVNLNDIMRKNPLITDFAPLPSRDLIMATASNPPVYQGRPPDAEPPPSGPGFLPPIIPTLLGVGLGGGGGSGTTIRHPTRTHDPNYPNTPTRTKYPGRGQGKSSTNDGKPNGRTMQGKTPADGYSHQPNDTPRKKKPKKPGTY